MSKKGKEKGKKKGGAKGMDSDAVREKQSIIDEIYNTEEMNEIPIR